MFVFLSVQLKGLLLDKAHLGRWFWLKFLVIKMLRSNKVSDCYFTCLIVLAKDNLSFKSLKQRYKRPSLLYGIIKIYTEHQQLVMYVNTTSTNHGPIQIRSRFITAWENSVCYSRAQILGLLSV